MTNTTNNTKRFCFVRFCVFFVFGFAVFLCFIFYFYVFSLFLFLNMFFVCLFYSVSSAVGCSGVVEIVEVDVKYMVL